jgi:subtilisin-like proprotein convertase family protein
MKKVLLAALLATGASSYAQMTVSGGFTATQLGNNLAGSNVNVTNATITGTGAQYGTFNYSGTGFPLSSGVILATGNITDAPGPNTNGATTGGMGGPGDPDLTAIAGIQTFDAVSFQFDFEVQSDQIEFSYIFASEEYNEFVGSGFNDVFAFYISGPGITGWENIALVPGTTVPVAINNINNGSYWQYYNDNTTNSFDTEYDGFTDVLVAKREGLIACQTYTLRLVIADAGDQAYDAAVFLQENSLVQSNVSATANTFSANNIALEGCIDASFTFNLDNALPYATEINIGIGGSAVNGVDYELVDTLIVIPAGQTSGTIVIDALSDGLPEGQESIELYFIPAPCQPQDTVILYIDDYQTLEFETIETDVSCAGAADGALDFTITGGTPPFSIIVTDSATNVTATYASYPISGLDTGTYFIQVIDGYGCPAEDIVAGNIFTGAPVFLPDGTGLSYTTSLPISGLSAGATLQSVSQLQSVCVTMEHSRMGELEILLEAPNGTQLVLKEQPGGAVTNLGEPCAIGPADAGNTDTSPGLGYTYCFTPSPTYGTMVSMANQNNYTYTTICYGTQESDKYLPAGSYQPFDPFSNLIGVPLNGNWTMIITDNIPNNNGWIFDWSISFAADPPDSIAYITAPDAPVVSFSSTQPACGQATGAIDITVTGDNPPFTYLWNTGATTEDLSGIPAGSYTVEVTDANNCSYDVPVSLSNSGALTFNATVQPQLCVGSSTGSIDLSIIGGTAPFSFSWSNGATTEDIAALAPGTYAVTATDAGGCIGSQNFTINPASALILTTATTNEQCGNQEGAVDLTVQGGVAGYTYSWSNGSTVQDLSDLVQGTYSVTVTDANGCNAATSVSITNLIGNCIPNCDLVLNNQQLTDETCGSANGSILIFAFSSFSPLSYSWNTGATTSSINGLTAGTYTLSIEDGQGCTLNETYTIVNQTGNLGIAGSSVTNETCGNGNGGVSITVTGGSQPYTFVWSNGATTQNISNQSAGSYTVDVTDANGCTLSQTFLVQNDAGSLTQTYGNADDEFCGQSNGSIDISVSGGTLPYQYVWSNGANTQDLLNLSAGNYTCVITDASGCSISTPAYTVNNQSGGLLISNIDIDNEVCGNALGEVLITVSGGTTPYTFAWSNGATTQNISGLSAGTYSCIVTDMNGCSVNTGNQTVQDLSGTLAVTNLAVINEICGNGLGMIDLTVTGGTPQISYLWSNNSASQDLTNVSGGAYSCSITDANGCSTQVNAFVANDPGALTIDNVIATGETCGDGTGTLSVLISGAAAPVNYTWSNGATTATQSGLSAGTYGITVTDASGCTAASNGVVTNQTTGLIVAIQSVTNELCGNGSGAIDLSVSGGTLPYTFAWSGGGVTEDITGLSAGTYSCVITDASGCSASTGPISLNNSNNNLSILLTARTDETCGNGQGAIDVNVSGGTAPYGYSWSNGVTAQDISGLTQGTYALTLTDANGCTDTETFTVSNSSSTLALISAAVTDEICGNGQGSIDIDVQGGTAPYSYAWTNGVTTQDLFGLNSGGYQVLIGDAAGCQVISPVYTVNSGAGAFSLISIAAVNELCSNNAGAVAVSLSGGAAPVSYTWNSGQTTEDLSGIGSGVYSCSAIDANGCALNYAVTVQNDPGTLTAANAVVQPSCGQSNGSIDLLINGGTPSYAIQWSNGSTLEDLSGISSGTYTATVTDATGCLINETVTVGGGGQLSIPSVSITNETCGNNQGAISVMPSGGTGPYTYSWTSASPCCDYTLEMFDANNNGWGAGAAVNVSINGLLYGTFLVPVAPGNNFESVSIPVCTGDQIQLEYVVPTGGNGNNSYQLLDGAGALVFASGANPVGGVSYSGVSSCSFGATTSTISGLSAGTYNVVVTDATGCSVNGSYSVINDAGSLQITGAVITDEFCGQANAGIDLSVSGGVAPLTYLWSNGATTQDLSGIGAGSYSITVTDDNGCSVNNAYTVTNSTGSFAITGVAVTPDFCLSGSGAIDLSVTGGATPYTFSWSNGATTEDLSALTAATYTVTITDAAGCMLDSAVAVANTSNGLTVTGIAVDEICGTDNGSVDITVTGGFTPYTYSWSNGASTEDLSGLSWGTYDVTVSDNTGCMEMLSFTVNNTGVSIAGGNVVDENCGDGNGSINAGVTGGTAPISYSWTASVSCCSYTINMDDTFGDGWNGATLEVSVNGNVVGTYAAAGFGSSASFPVCTGDLIEMTYTPGQFENENSYTVLNPSGNPVFADGPTPSTGMVFSGIGSCSFSATGSAAISNLSAGTYTLTVQDGSGCLESMNFVVNNSTGTLNVALVSQTNANCGLSDGAIDLAVSGGTAPVTINWSNGFTTEDLNGLTIGNYNVTVTDAAGCSINQQYTITDNSTLSIDAFTVTDDNCLAGTGAVDMSVSGGVAPYGFVWTNGSNTEDLSGLAAGQYIVEVTDITGCVRIDTVVVGNSSTVTIASTVIDETCGAVNGSIDLTATGGTSPYTYSWSNGATTEDLSAIASGNYTVTVTDNAGCAQNAVIAVANNGANITGFSVIDESCGNSNGMIQANITGAVMPITYSWSGGPSSGCCSYTLEMFDTFGDGWNGGQLEVFVNGLSVGTFAAAGTGSISTFPVCTGDAFELVYTAGQWEEENTYNLIDASGNILFSDGINPATGSVFTGTANCTFSAGTNPLNGLAAGTYVLTITDGAGCVDTDSVTVLNDAGTLAVTGSITDESCGDGSGAVNLNVTGGTSPYTFYWNTGATTEDISGLSAGSYTVTVNDDGGCQLDQTFSVGNATGGLGAVISSVADTYCGAITGSVDITVAGGTSPYTYLWSNGATTEDITGVVAGTYDVVITDATGCALTLSATIQNTTNGLALSAVAQDAVCGSANGAVDLTITGGVSPYTVSWSNGSTTEDITALANGSYTATVTDNTGCTDFVTVDVMYDPGNLNISGGVVTNEFCGFDNGDIDLSVAGGTAPFTYSWSDGQTTQDATGLAQGSYTVTVTDNNGCTDMATYNVINTALFVVSDTLITSATCQTCADGAVNITLDWGGGPSPVFTYSWSSGQTTQDINGVVTGQYTVTITDDNGCSLTETYTVPYDTNLTVTGMERINVQVYPNPSTGLFVIDYLLITDTDASIVVFDVIGQQVMQRNLTGGTKGRVTIDLSAYSNGIYMLELQQNGQRAVKRLTLQR